MPSLTYAGRWTLAGGALLSVGGVLGAVEPLASAGAGLLVSLALAYVNTLALPRRMRRERLEFTWWLVPNPRGRRHPEEPARVRVLLRNPTDATLVFSVPRLALSPGVTHARFEQQRVEVPPRAVSSFELEVRAWHAGRHVLHGAWMTLAGPFGLAWAPLYFPNPLLLEVGPRGAGSLRAPRGGPAGSPLARAGRTVRRAGEGPEVRELRDLQPGDPFRRIAWKASARRGRMLVRETDDEAQTARVLVLDASATMRGDERGGAKIDYAIELAAQAARLSLAGGDALGLVGFDARVLAHLAPGSGPAHLRQVVDAAVSLRALADEDLTDVDEETLVRTVARYFREQEGLDALQGEHPYQARPRLASLCEQRLAGDATARLPLLARDGLSRALRAFCRARGIALPLKHDASGRAKCAGLAAALRASIERARGPRTVLVVSDLDPLIELDAAVRGALGAARQRHHRVTVVAPVGEGFLRRGEATDPRASRRAAEADELHPAPVRGAVRSLFLDDELARVREVRAALARVGVPLYTARAREPVARWLARAAQGTRAARGA